MYAVFLYVENTLVLKGNMIKSLSADNTGYVHIEQLGGKRQEIDSCDTLPVASAIRASKHMLIT
jgi:hypothetical protein